MPKVGKKEFAYTKAGMKSAKAYAAKTGKKVTKAPSNKYAMKPGRMYTGGSADFNESTGTYRSTGTKRSPKAPNRTLERMPRIKTRAK